MRILCLGFFWCGLFPAVAWGQSSNLSFENEPIETILKQLEADHHLIFNYSPTLLAPYTFTGQLEGTSVQNILSTLLAATPIDFSVSETTVLLFRQEKTSYQLCGYLIDAVSKAPLALANVYLDDYLSGTQTDAQGYFDLTIKATKNQQLRLSYIGYQDQAYTVLQANDPSCPTYALQLDADLFGDEIIITDYLLDGIEEGAAYSSIQMDYDQLSASHATVEQDILKTVQLLPGITSVDESAVNLLIRGNTADQNLVLWEGVPLYDPGHLFGMISAINPFVVNEVKVLKGVFDPSYANRVGGIIDMSLSDSLVQRWQGGLGSTLSEAHAFLKAPLIKEHLSVMLSGRYSLNGLYDSPPINNFAQKVFQLTKVDDQQQNFDEEEANIEQVLDYYDWNAKVLFQPSDKLLLKASFFNSINNFDYEFRFLDNELRTFDQVRTRSNAASVSLQFRPSGKWQTTMSYAQSEYSYNYQFLFQEVADELLNAEQQTSNSISDQTITLNNAYQLTPNWKLGLGYDYNFKDVEFSVQYNAAFEQNYVDINEMQGAFHNVFATVDFEQSNLLVNTGFRAIYYQDLQSWDFSPRFNLQYAFNRHWKLKASAGIFHQYVSQLREFGEADLGVSSPVWVLSQPETESSLRSDKLAAGLIFHNKGWLVDAEVYYTNTTGLNTSAPLFRQQSISDIFLSGSSESSGIDLLIKKNWNDFSLWLNYSYNASTYLFKDYSPTPFTASNNIVHNLGIIGSYHLQNWHFSLNWQIRSGLPYSIPTGINEVSDEEEEDNFFYFIDYEALNEARLPNFSRLDLSINFRPRFKQTALKAEFGLTIINLLNQENVFSRDFFLDDVDDQALPVGILVAEKRSLELTPQLLVRVYW
ncbi:MAG: TonB-dependent receptor [Bacteroidota bacterium]